MKRPIQSILGMLEIQLKNGYIKEVPPEYEFLRRYPPVTVNSDNLIKPDLEKFSYIKYYKRAISKNPLFVGDHVYPAYWRQQPIAMVLAQKQYDLISKGMDEEEAYKVAIKEIDNYENKIYENLKKVTNQIGIAMNAHVPFTTNTEIMSTIENYRMKLMHTKYEDLPLNEQGEIDYFIQTTLLKWNEVDRERRMKDPIFFQAFESLRATLFNNDNIYNTNKNSYENLNENSINKQAEERKNMMRQYLILNDLTPDYICTSLPFFYDDYLYYFNRISNQPILKEWSDTERKGLIEWITKTLTYKQNIENKSNETVTSVLDRAQYIFFPMLIHTPSQQGGYTVPSKEEIREVLYSRDIGYKTYKGKLYVKRSYKLPMIFFPAETVATSIITDEDKLRWDIVCVYVLLCIFTRIPTYTPLYSPILTLAILYT